MKDFTDLRLIPCPQSRPSVEHFAHMYWFDHMVMMKRRSDMSYEPCILNICPMSGMLMYYDGYTPLGWTIITEPKVQEAYKKWLNDLCDKHFTS